MDVRLHLDGPARQLGARQILDAGSSLLILLDEAGKHDDDTRITWVLADTSHGSLELALTPLSDDQLISERAARAATQVVAGVRALRRHAAIPAGWSDRMVRAASRLHVTGGNVQAVSITVDESTETIDEAVADNAKAALAGTESSVGGVAGVLDKLDLRSSPPTVGLIDRDTGEAITCRFRDDLTHTIIEALQRLVHITGALTRNAAGQKRTMDIWDVEIIDRKPPVPVDQLVGVLGPDWTGGAGSVEWTRAQRGN